MKQIFSNPTISDAFEAQLRQRVVSEFDNQLKPAPWNWQWWLPVSMSVAAIALLIVISGGAEQAYTKVQLSGIEQELAAIEQELSQDMVIEDAIQFSNL